ncbi:MAG: hypothetical protein Q8M16_24485 [Pirellulaceae bacterium]|nr:hypothetical protein [Pirellulaceae bacterium]
MLARHQMTPGRTANAVAHWPESSLMTRNKEGFSIVLFAHPRCVCTNASLQEFRRLLEDARIQLQAHVAICQPLGTPDDWLETEQVSAAKSIPGVQFFVDHEGREANRFGATTSGHVALFGPGGPLLFSGGITWGRGHVGENPGRRRVTQLLDQPTTETNGELVSVCPVFGCPLLEE